MFGILFYQVPKHLPFLTNIVHTRLRIRSATRNAFNTKKYKEQQFTVSWTVILTVSGFVLNR
jgi:hypothetical protein